MEEDTDIIDTQDTENISDFDVCILYMNYMWILVYNWESPDS